MSTLARVALHYVDGTMYPTSPFFFLLQCALHLLTMLFVNRQTPSHESSNPVRVQSAILHAQLKFPRVFRARRLATKLLSCKTCESAKKENKAQTRL